MKKGILKKLLLICSAVCMAMTIVVTPPATVPAQAKAPEVSETNKEAVEWIFMVAGRKLYKRLFNHSTGHWIGDWVYVRDLAPGEFQ